jgi:hypothetical protein
MRQPMRPTNPFWVLPAGDHVAYGRALRQCAPAGLAAHAVAWLASLRANAEHSRIKGDLHAPQLPRRIHHRLPHG